jgi:outer membrane protein insertion porin family
MVGYLDRFGIWDMQRSGVRLEHTPGGDEDEVELVLGLRERGRMFLKAGTEVGGGEGGGVRVTSLTTIMERLICRMSLVESGMP